MKNLSLEEVRERQIREKAEEDWHLVFIAYGLTVSTISYAVGVKDLAVINLVPTFLNVFPITSIRYNRIRTSRILNRAELRVNQIQNSQ